MTGLFNHIGVDHLRLENPWVVEQETYQLERTVTLD
jgi:hypothetical protein